MKRIVFLCVILFCVLSLSAQQDPQFSQNMFNKLANNPGYAGSTSGISTSVLHRSQWMGFDDEGAAASTQNFSVDAEVPILNGGVGLNIVKDNIASFSNLGIQASYAYRTQLGFGQIGMGMSVGMYQSGLNGGALRPSQAGDPVIPTGDVNGSKLDIGAGVYFNNQNMYIGLSSAHMTEPTIEWSDGQSYNLARHYFLISGYNYEINPQFSLHPSIYLKHDGATSQLDINTNLIYNNKMWSGVSYRVDEGVIILVGMDINESLRFGVGYDVTIINPMSNSFEFMLGYNFKVKTTKTISKYKNPRFL
ncbi:MAG: type IX secretion system membrane protein PorP/SprF [Flavobacteriales bacterium]|nr:type IX secretion system membrane protein PorP/SprF [Flavobacteriales bacterium]